MNPNYEDFGCCLLLQDLEKVLDVFNITLGRQQAHMEVNTVTEIRPEESSG